jgi:tetratricopeptide (TPR) repeat protein
MLGFLAIARGDYASARSTIEEALAMSRRAGDQRGISVNVANLGFLSAWQGRFEEALPLLRESVLLAHELLDVGGVASQLEDIAAVAAARSGCEQAAVMLGGAEVLYEATGSAFLPVQHEQHARTVSILRRELDTDQLARSWDRGRKMTPDQLVAYAVEFIDSSG